MLLVSFGLDVHLSNTTNVNVLDSFVGKYGEKLKF